MERLHLSARRWNTTTLAVGRTVAAEADVADEAALRRAAERAIENPPPPSAPDVGARTILYCARHPVRDADDHGLHASTSELRERRGHPGTWRGP